MPKLKSLPAIRTRASLEYTECTVCKGRTFAIEQNHCNACDNYICVPCAAFQRNYCCEGYIKQFWFGFMNPECEALAKALENKKGIKRALNNFGTDNNEKISAEYARYTKYVQPLRKKAGL